MTRWAVRLAALAVAVLAGAGLWSASTAAGEPASLEQQTRAVAATLRCPSCAGENVADSSAPLAAAMRATVAEQLRDGRSPGEVRQWFAERYGAEVLLDPPPQGSAWLLWLLPLVAAGAGAAVVVRVGGTSRRPVAVAAGLAVAVAGGSAWSLSRDSGPLPLAEPSPTLQAGTVDVLEQVVAASPGDVHARIALGRALDGEGRLEEAVDQYGAAARLAPFDPVPSYLQAFALARSGEPVSAVPLLDRALQLRPDHAPSLLLLGTLRHQDGDPRGEALLRRFLDADPDHPAVPRVRHLLGEDR